MFNLNLLLIICLEVYIIDIEVGAESDFYTNEFETDHKNNLESKFTHNKSLLPGSCLAEQHIPVIPGCHSAEHHVLEDIASIIKFDMIYSGPSADPTSATID